MCLVIGLTDKASEENGAFITGFIRKKKIKNRKINISATSYFTKYSNLNKFDFQTKNFNLTLGKYRK